MITNFKLKKPNLWIDFLDIIGYDYERITFERKREKYCISSYGKVCITTQAGELAELHIDNLSKDIKDEINNEIEKMY